MKQSELIALGLAALAVYMIVKPKSASAKTGGVTGFVNEILGAGGAAFENGWRYFDNGTAIDPNGNYYYEGRPVWSADRSFV